MDEKITVEGALYEAVAAGDEGRAAAILAATPRDELEFTGRCFAGAITRGLVETSVLFARSGFHLNVMDEPALARGDVSLRDFMQRHQAAHIQRTYYLPVVQSELSCGPVRALLESGAGLSAHDAAELLSLAVRMDRVPLARVLVEGGATLTPDIHQSIPDDLVGKNELSRNQSTEPWAEMLSPRSEMETIDFVLEQLGEEPAPIRREWFKLYFRDPAFSQKLAAIALHATPESCEDAGSTLLFLARGGHARALEHVASWPGLAQAELSAAREAARDAGRAEAVAVLLAPRGARAEANGGGPGVPGGLEPLEL